MLCALGEAVVALREEYREDIADTELFSQLRGQNVVFVSTDRRQLRREVEGRALKQAGITALYFGPFFDRKNLWEQAAWVVTRWPMIKDFAESADAGAVAEISQKGKALVHPF